MAPQLGLYSTAIDSATGVDGTRDPDGDTLRYKWWIYSDAGSRGVAPRLTTIDATHARLVVPPAEPFPGLGAAREVHVILEVWDGGAPALVGYRRAVVTVRP